MEEIILTDNNYSGNIQIETEKEFELSYDFDCNISMAFISEKNFELKVKNFA